MALHALIYEISRESVSTAVHMETHHLHAYNTDVARSNKELNTVDYGKMTHSPGGLETQINANLH